MSEKVGFARRSARFGILAAMSAGVGQTFFIGLFGTDLQQATGLDIAGFGAYYGIATLASGLLMFWLGEVADRLALRRAVTLAVLCTACGCMLMSFLQTPTQLLIAFLLLRFGGQGLTAHLAIVAAARYGARRRGRTLAAASIGFIIAEALFPLLVAAAFIWTGWRAIWLGMGAVLLLLALPLLRRLASPLRFETSQPGVRHGPALGRLRLLRTPAFIAALTIVLTPSFVITAVFFHQATLGNWQGWSPASVAGAFLLFAFCRLAGTLGMGRAVDYFGPLQLMRFHLLPLAGGLLALGYASPFLSLWLLFAGLGLTIGACSVLNASVWTELFGSRQLGLVRGVYAALMVSGTAAAPFLAGLMLQKPDTLVWITALTAAYAALIPFLALPFMRRHYNSLPPLVEESPVNT